MDPATIYAITVTLVGFGLPPDVTVIPMPPEWTMDKCIEEHEAKFADRPDAKAMCVSWQRFKRPLEKRYLISIRSDDNAVDLTKWQGTLTECQDIVQRYSATVVAFCVEARKLERSSKPRHG